MKGDMFAYDRNADANNASADNTYVDIVGVYLIEPGWALCVPAGPRAPPPGLFPGVLANTTYIAAPCTTWPWRRSKGDSRPAEPPRRDIGKARKLEVLKYQ